MVERIFGKDEAVGPNPTVGLDELSEGEKTWQILSGENLRAVAAIVNRVIASYSIGVRWFRLANTASFVRDAGSQESRILMQD